MARKTCPQCKRITGASAMTCSGCGHAFGPAAVAVAQGPAVKRCLMCGLTNVATATRCECGADLDVDPADLRTLIAHRRSSAWALLLGSIVLGIASIIGGVVLLVGLSLVSPKLSIGALAVAFAGVGAATAGCRKAMRIFGATRATRDELDAKASALPQAKLRP
jgi:hypothetical protein